ncbi:translocation/assembly module TamB domain-containing protein [Niabella terrae]
MEFSLFNKMHLQDVLLEDQKKDTILSAGAVTVNITDWFFIKDNIVLKYLGLRDTYIHLKRTDSVWNHQFLLDYFRTPASTSPKKQKSISLAVREIDLKNILFKKEDQWLGQDMTASLASLSTDPKNVDFPKKIIEINALQVNKPYLAIRNYAGRRPPRIKAPEPEPVQPATDSLEPQWNPGNWNIRIASIRIRDGLFKSDNEQRTPSDPGVFDGAHMQWSKVNGDLSDLSWQVDTIRAKLVLETVEKSGFEVKKLAAQAKVTPYEMTFNQLDIRTNDSHLKNHFSMKFSDFSDMNDFEEKVVMEGHFQESEINSDDIAFFAPALKSWKKRILLTGRITGPVAALEGQQLEIKAGSNTYFKGNASLTGLPKINSTFIYIKANAFRTIYTDAVAFVPAIKNIRNPDLSRLQFLEFEGNYTGFIRDFVTFGTLRTNLGTVKADVNMKLHDSRNPVYSGNISSENFNLGPFIRDTNIGFVSFRANLKGAGFDPQGGNVALDARINYLDFKNYRYRQIVADGELNKSIFDGTIIVNDPNARFNLNGLVNFSGSVPEFNFLANIDTLNLKTLHLLKDDISLKGKINAQFTGNSIDDFLGTAQVSDAAMTRGGFPLSFSHLELSSAIVDGQKHLRLSSNEFNASLTGTFNIRDLPNSVTGFLSRYYPSYISRPDTVASNQVFSFNIKTNNFDDLASVIDSSLYGFSNSTIEGRINTTTNSLILDVDVPYFRYRNLSFSNVALDATGGYDSLTLYGSTSNIGIGDSLQVQLATFNITAHNDLSTVNIYTGGNKTVDQARINAMVRTYRDGVGIEFGPSNFVLNGKSWTVQEKGQLEFRKSSPAHGQLLLRENQQEIRIETLPSDIGSWNDLGITLHHINLADFAPYFLPQNRLEGLIDADVLIENPGPEMKINSRNFTGHAIRFDNDSLGDISAEIVFDMPTRELLVNGRTLGTADKSLAYDIHLYLKDAESQEQNIISLTPTNFDLKYVNRFLEFLFSDMTGEVTGQFDIKGPLNAVRVVGRGRLHNAGLRVNFTQCYYRILDREISLDENQINLNGIVLEDTVTGNPIYLNGNISHSSFQNMFFDVVVSTRKPGTRDRNNNRPVQVLKTSYANNKTFYGDVKATGSFVLIGPQDNTYMKIDAIASDEEESEFTIASSESRAGKMPDWLVERTYGEEMQDSSYRPAASSNLTYELDITANPKVLMRFVMDDLTGDQIVGRGSGSLNIKSGTSEPLAIRGRLDIDEGTYNFTFQSFFKKPFEIIRGTENYISWTGDPLNAHINIQAQYKAERVSFAPLSGLSIDPGYANIRENVFVYATLTGQLFKPDFKFELQLDPTSRFNNDFNVTNQLQQIERSQSEITRQVTYLIVFNSFAPPQTGVSNIGIGAAVNELTYNTISSLSGLFFNEINKKLNNALNSLLGTEVSVVFSGSVYNRSVLGTQSSNFNINQANVSGAVLVPLFDERFVISLGSSLEVPIQSSFQRTVQFLPDVTAEWLLNPAGTIRLNLFYRENLDFLTTASSGAAKLKRTGAGISFRREFNTLRELFVNPRKRLERRLQTDSLQVPVPDSIRLQMPDSSRRVEPVTTEKSKDSMKPTLSPDIE